MEGLVIQMQQYTSAVDKELHAELVNVEANPLREMPLAGMNEAQRRRARQLAFMLTMHTKDRALQMITKLSGPANGFEIWRRFLEEWEPAHRVRYRAMLMQLLHLLRETEVRPWRNGNDSGDNMKHKVRTRFRTRSKQQYWHTTHRIQNDPGTLD